MVNLISNSVDASYEKHIPTFELVGDEILVKVNHVMEKEHFNTLSNAGRYYWDRFL